MAGLPEDVEYKEYVKKCMREREEERKFDCKLLQTHTAQAAQYIGQNDFLITAI